MMLWEKSPTTTDLRSRVFGGWIVKSFERSSYIRGDESIELMSTVFVPDTNHVWDWSVAQ